MKENGKMSFEVFKNLVGDSIVSWLPERFRDANVTFQVVTKNNNLQLTGMTIMLPNKNISPTVYLEDFYEAYLNGTDMGRILEQIASLQLERDMDEEFDIKSITEFGRCRHKIFPRLINAEWNKDILESVPYVKMADLAVIFYIDMGTDDRGHKSIKIHNDLMKMWDTSAEALYDIAISNLKKENEGTFKSMSDVLMEMMFSDIIDEENNEMQLILLPTKDTMFVLSNLQKVNGANVILNDEMMKQVIDIVGEEFFILPSSIHELLIVPGSMEVEDLREMVNDVNDTQVSLEERLSDNVYIYTLAEGLKIA